MEENSYNTGEIDIKELLTILGRHKFFIFFMGLSFAIIFAAHAYYQPNVYRSDAVVELGSSKRSSAQKENVLSMALGGGKVNLDTEIGIMQSRNIAMNVFRKMDFTHRYVAINGYKRHVELYGKDVPIEVIMKKGFNLIFSMYPLDSKKYRLEVKGRDDNGSKWEYEKVNSYNKEVKDSHFNFTLLVKDIKELKADKYLFSVFDVPKAIKDLHRRISIEQLTEKSSLVQIGYEDIVPQRTQDVANALANSYIEYAIKTKTAEASSILDFIDAQLAEIDSGLKESENELERYKSSTSTVSLAVKSKDVVTKLSEYETELKKNDIKRRMLNTLYKKVKAGTDLETISVAGLDLDESLTTLIEKLQDALLERRPLLEEYTSAHRKVISINRVIFQLKKMIRSNIEALKKHIDKRQNLLEKNVSDQKELLEALPENERKLGRLQRNFTVNEKVYSFLLEKRASAVIAKAGTISANKILDDATLPREKSGPKRTIIVITGLLLGLLLGAAFVLFRNYLNSKIKDEDELRKLTSLPIIGTIPKFDDADGIAKVFEAPKSAATEAFRTLRTNLGFLSQEQDCLMITNTSTISGEGKTTISINLGAIMSLTGKKTIIVDLDMRKPQLHNRLKLSNSQGISSVLAKKEKLFDVIQRAQYEEYFELDFISSGPIPPNPSELIESEMMTEVIHELKQKYDVVIFDTPPVGLVTDAMIIMPQADISIYVVREGYSEKDFINNVDRIVKEHDIKHLGIVLNDVAYEKVGYGYGHGYYHEN